MKRVLIAWACAACVAIAAPASAHEQRSVGALRVVIGWQNEPAVAGFLNAVQLRVTRGTAPVANARLRVQVTFADRSTEQLALEAAFGSPGEYLAPIVPTRPGSYTFHVTGTVGSTRFDQRFTSGERTFDDVEASTALEFPEQDPSRAELGDRARTIDSRVAAAAGAADDASGRATLALIVGAAGLVLGVVGLLASLGKGRRAQR